MAIRYVLGPRMPITPGNMWDIIRGYVAAAKNLTHDDLIEAMAERKFENWPEKVRIGKSIQVVGSRKWCHGYIRGATREGYLAVVVPS